MTVRYMGTKRLLAPVVRSAFDGLEPRGPIVDLFSGMGSVAQALASCHPVVTNDLLSFTTTFSRCRFTSEKAGDGQALIRQVNAPYQEQRDYLRRFYGRRLRLEATAVDEGRDSLQKWFDTAPHVGNSRHYRDEARNAQRSEGGPEKHRLAVLYFATGYFSTDQAIQIDSLRYAIETTIVDPGELDWARAAWLSASSSVLNAPGHTAQFLKPTTDQSFGRIKRTWRHNVWPYFVAALENLRPTGSLSWRRSNRVENQDALALLKTLDKGDIAGVYADPPYTKDQYSRYYHVYETLYRYDFPDSVGKARARSDRFSTGFCLATAVESSLEELVESTARLDRPLVLSYPSDGLLASRGLEVSEVIERHRPVSNVISIPHRHSTMGGSGGSKIKEIVEKIYVCS